MTALLTHSVRILPLLGSLLALPATVHAQKIDYSRRADQVGPAIPSYPVAYSVPTAAEVKASLDRIFGYVTAHSSFRVFDNATGEELATPNLADLRPAAVVDARLGALNRWDYPNGVILSAFNDIADATGDRRYRDYGVDFFRFIFDWQPYFVALEKKTGKRNDYSRMVHMSALDHCGAITAALIRIQRQQPDERFLAWIRAVDDFISHRQFRFEDGTLARERPQPRSLWTDDFYMSIAFLAQMGVLTGETRYWDDAVRQVTQLSARLFDADKGLYDHGWSENTDGYDPRFYWARANGWAALAMTELLDVLPESHPGRDRVLHLYRQHLRGVVERQDGSGLWHNMLDRPETYLETSASGMFVYALAKGVNRGWLSPIYGPAALTGWNGIATRILPDGRVDGICEGTTYANDATYYEYRGASANTTFFGSVLYAGAEITRLLNNPELTIVPAEPGSFNSAIHVRLKSAKTKP